MLKYCNNKGLASKVNLKLADLTGSGEYVLVNNDDLKVENVKYCLLSKEQKDNIKCQGQKSR